MVNVVKTLIFVASGFNVKYTEKWEHVYIQMLAFIKCIFNDIIVSMLDNYIIEA